jgi:hypothetical protein
MNRYPQGLGFLLCDRFIMTWAAELRSAPTPEVQQRQKGILIDPPQSVPDIFGLTCSFQKSERIAKNPKGSLCQTLSKLLQ